MRLTVASAIAFGLAAALVTVGVQASASDGECDFTGWQSYCDVSNSGDQIDLGAGITNPGTPSTDPHPDSGAGQTYPNPPTTQPVVPAEPEDCPLNRCDLPYDVVSPPDVTLADLASFRPARPSLEGEPAGFGVVGMPANIVAAASEQRISGTLLGWEATVRFVPAGFVFEYGDGSTVRSATGGTSWRQLGQAQFTPTATSHVYLARGTYPVAVTVQYSASVDFGSGNWRPVAGYVTATTGGYDVRVVEVRTALVDKTCAENPSGPGC